MSGPSYVPPSALEVIDYEPVEYPTVEVAEWIARLRENWTDELMALERDVFARWEAYGRAAGGKDFLDAAMRGLIDLDTVSQLQRDATAVFADEVAATVEITVTAVVDQPDRVLEQDEVRSFAYGIAREWLTERQKMHRAALAIVLKAGEAPEGVEFVHRRVVMGVLA